MYLRFARRRKDGKEHRYWSIVESRRCAGGRVVQRPLLYLGEINDGQREAWCHQMEAFDEASGRHRRPVTRYPAGFSQRSHSPLILTALLYLRRVIGRFACAHLSDTHLHGLIRTFPPTLTTMTLNHRRLERFDTRL